jgi:hypothetical protein
MEVRTRDVPHTSLAIVDNRLRTIRALSSRTNAVSHFNLQLSAQPESRRKIPVAPDEIQR